MSDTGAQPAATASTDPDWLLELSSLLTISRGEPVGLPLPDAIKEIDGWLRHKRQEPWRRSANRTGLDAEIRLSSSMLGPETTTALAGPLPNFLAALRQATDAPSPTPTHRHAALAGGELLTVALATPGVLRAAWVDLVRAVKDEQPAPTCMARLQLLISALELAGHDVQRLLQRMSSLLENDALALAEAQASLGVAKAPDDWSDLVGQLAAATPDERLSLCEELIASPPSTGRCIAWVAYKEAQVGTELASGPCLFLNALWAIDNAKREDGQDFLGRRELQDDLSRPPDPAIDEHVVLARVDLGWRTPAGAMQAAVDLVCALTDTAYLRSGGARWVPYGWEMLLVDGRRVSSRVFATDDVLARWPRPYVLERTSAELAATGNKFGEVLAASPLPPDLSEAVRSATEAESADLRSKILLYDRVTELVAANAGAEDAEDLRRLIASSWPVSTWRADVLNAVELALEAGRWGETREAAAELGRQIRTPLPNGGYTLDLVGTADRAEDLVKLLPGDARVRAEAQTLRTFHDATAYVAYLELREQECVHLSDRLRRVRNALAHANPVQVTTIRTVTALAQYVASAALSEALDAFRDGHDMFDRLTEYEMHRVADLQTITAGTTPASLLRDRGLA